MEDKKNGRRSDKITQKKKGRNDLILIGGMIIAALILLVVVWLVFFQEGTTAVVSLNGSVILEQPLDEDCRIPIQTENGYNLFLVENGVALVAEADCRDQICVEHAGISRKGETIVCLPHKLVVEIQK